MIRTTGLGLLLVSSLLKVFQQIPEKDIAVPVIVGHLPHQPPISGGFGEARCHTILPLSKRPYAIMTSEGERFSCFTKDIIKNVAQPMNMIGMVDVSDVANPTLIAIFPYPEVPEDYPYGNFNDCGIGCPGPFAPTTFMSPMTTRL